jgi:hypothetical protein
MNEQYNTPLPPVGPRNSTMAIISLIGGIAGLTVLPVLGSLAGIIFGHIAKNEIKKSGGMIGGNGMATWGLVLGYIAIGLAVCGCIVYAGFMIWAIIQGNSSYSY